MKIYLHIKEGRETDSITSEDFLRYTLYLIT